MRARQARSPAGISRGARGDDLARPRARRRRPRAGRARPWLDGDDLARGTRTAEGSTVTTSRGARAAGASSQAPWRRRGWIARPLPLLGPPGAEALRGFSRGKLRAAAEHLGLAAPPRASREELAQLLATEEARAQAERADAGGEPAFDSRAGE